MPQKSLVSLYFDWNWSAKNNQEQWQQTLFLLVVLIEVFGSMMMRHELKASWSTSLGMSQGFGFHRKVSSSLKHSRHVWEYSIPAARTIYFMGIIDILTPYDEMKKFEHRFKACVILVWWSFVLHFFDQWLAAAQQTRFKIRKSDFMHEPLDIVCVWVGPSVWHNFSGFAPWLAWCFMLPSSVLCKSLLQLLGEGMETEGSVWKGRMGSRFGHTESSLLKPGLCLADQLWSCQWGWERSATTKDTSTQATKDTHRIRISNSAVLGALEQSMALSFEWRIV